MVNEEQTKPVEIVDINGYWSIRNSPIKTTRLLNEARERIKAWPNTKESGLEFVCSNSSGISYSARMKNFDHIEDYVREVGGTHYEILAFGHLQVYRTTQPLTTDDDAVL